MDSVSEEAYNNFIEVSNEADDYEDFEELGDIDSEKENSKKAKSEPTKLAQIDKIIAFVKEYNDQPIEKSVYDSLWTSLVDDLNSLGPPIYTIDKWKRVWSQYKYRNKKRFLTREDVPSHSNPKRERGSTDQVSIPTENTLSSQMFKVLEQQDIILTTLTNHGTIIERNTNILEEISKKMR